MSAYVDDVLDGLRSRPMTGGGQYMFPGKYEVQLKKIEIKKSENPQKMGAKMLISEFTIVKSNNPKHIEGSTGTWVSKFDAYGLTLSNLKSLFFAAMQLDTKDEDAHVLVELVAKAVCNPSSPAVKELASPPYEIDDPAGLVLGQVVELECYPIKTKDGRDFTKYVWSAKSA